jgi:predicted enzyme related to lactoylglutathione lyase
VSSTVDPAAGAEFGLRRIHQIAVTVQDVERATAFYRDALGMPLLFRAPAGLSFFDCGGVRLMLSLPEGAETPRGNSILYYGVDDIEAAHGTLVRRGVRFIGDPHVVARLPDREVWLAEFRDSEGNVLALMSERAH